MFAFVVGFILSSPHLAQDFLSIHVYYTDQLKIQTVIKSNQKNNTKINISNTN